MRSSGVTWYINITMYLFTSGLKCKAGVPASKYIFQEYEQHVSGVIGTFGIES